LAMFGARFPCLFESGGCEAERAAPESSVDFIYCPHQSARIPCPVW